MKAIVLGATGATGKDMVQCLMADASVEEITVLVRNQVTYNNPKVTVHVVDFDKPENWKHLVQGDVLFSMMGTTLKQAGSKDSQWKVDYTYQYEVAKAACENGVTRMILMSAMSADAKSRYFYIRMKGQLEDDIIRLGFPHTFIVRPPSLIRKNTTRFSETFSIWTIRCFNAIGLLRGFTPVPTLSVAKQMIEGAKTITKKVQIADAKEVIAFSKKDV